MNKHLGPSRGGGPTSLLILYFLVTLIGAVVIVGLVRDQIDTAALVALSTLAGGIAGLAAKGGSGGSSGDGEGEQ